MNFKTTIPQDKSDVIYLSHTGTEREYKCTKPLLVVQADNTWCQAQYVHATKSWYDMDMGRYDVPNVVKWCDVTEHI